MEQAIQELMKEKASLHSIKLAYTLSVLKACQWNKNQAYQILGISRYHLIRMIKRYAWENKKNDYHQA